MRKPVGKPAAAGTAASAPSSTSAAMTDATKTVSHEAASSPVHVERATGGSSSERITSQRAGSTRSQSSARASSAARTYARIDPNSAAGGSTQPTHSASRASASSRQSSPSSASRAGELRLQKMPCATEATTSAPQYRFADRCVADDAGTCGCAGGGSEDEPPKPRPAALYGVTKTDDHDISRERCESEGDCGVEMRVPSASILARGAGGRAAREVRDARPNRGTRAKSKHARMHAKVGASFV